MHNSDLGPLTNTTAHNIHKDQRLQNRAANILTGNDDYVNARGVDLVKSLGLMNVSQRRNYFMIIIHLYDVLIHSWSGAKLSM